MRILYTDLDRWSLNTRDVVYPPGRECSDGKRARETGQWEYGELVVRYGPSYLLVLGTSRSRCKFAAMLSISALLGWCRVPNWTGHRTVSNGLGWESHLKLQSKKRALQMCTIMVKGCIQADRLCGRRDVRVTQRWRMLPSNYCEQARSRGCCGWERLGE